MGTKKKAAKATTETTEAAIDVAQEVAAESTDGGAAQVNAGPTLNDVANGYLAAIEADDAGQGTLSSYKMELKLAMRELGEATPLADLTPEKVQAYFESDTVMRTKNGKPKAQPTWAKTRRVLRLALLWAQDAGLCQVAPIPAPPVKIVPLALS